MSVLVVDGEMPSSDVQERISASLKSLGKKCRAPHRVIASDQLAGGPIDLRKRVWQEAIAREGATSKIIFLDNVTTLGGDSADSNSAESWTSIQRWMTKMRARGQAIIWFHNDGKAGIQLGTATRETVLDTSIQLKNGKHKGASTCFTVSYTKPRWFYGSDRDPFDVKLETDSSGKQTWSHSKSKNAQPESARIEKAVALHDQGMSYQAIADKLKVSKSTAERWVKKDSEGTEK